MKICKQDYRNFTLPSKGKTQTKKFQMFYGDDDSLLIPNNAHVQIKVPCRNVREVSRAVV